MKVKDIIDVLEQAAPPSLQESYDNTGLQVGDPDREATGVLLCVDLSPEVVREAVARGANMVVSHHPVLFRGLKQIVGRTLPERTVLEAIKSDVALYSCHTSIDSARGGVSAEMAERLGLRDVEVLEKKEDPSVGLGAVGNLPEPLQPEAFVRLVKNMFGSPVARCSRPREGQTISRVALCGGSGSSLIDLAVAAGADAYLTSDTSYHAFVDRRDDLFLVDIGHYESENCVKQIFYRVITEKFPNFAVHYSETEKNPIVYL